MRSLYRTLGPGLIRDLTLLCLADAVVGVSFGALAVGAGLPAWLPVLLSLAVFAGASQFLLVGVVASGGSLLAAVAAGLLVNARHVPFGFAVAETVRGGTGPPDGTGSDGSGRDGAGRRAARPRGGTGWGGVARRLAGTHLMVDESVAFAVAQPDPRRRAAVYWACGISLFVGFNLATLAGVAAGRAVGNTDAWGLDAAFPAVLLALVVPALRDRGARRAALLGAGIALAASTVLPPGLPVLLALPAVALAARTPAEPAAAR